jgi:hypothetical protein
MAGVIPIRTRHKMVHGFIETEKRNGANVEVRKITPERYGTVIGAGQAYNVVQEGNQFYVADKATGQAVTKPVGGAFIAFGQIKELEGGKSATMLKPMPTSGGGDTPFQRHTEKGESGKKSEKEHEKEAEDRLEDMTKHEKETGPGGHEPDGTGPHGRGEGPGNGVRENCNEDNNKEKK